MARNDSDQFVIGQQLSKNTSFFFHCFCLRLPSWRKNMCFFSIELLIPCASHHDGGYHWNSGIGGYGMCDVFMQSVWLSHNVCVQTPKNWVISAADFPNMGVPFTKGM